MDSKLNEEDEIYAYFADCDTDVLQVPSSVRLIKAEVLKAGEVEIIPVDDDDILLFGDLWKN